MQSHPGAKYIKQSLALEYTRPLPKQVVKKQQNNNF